MPYKFKRKPFHIGLLIAILTFLTVIIYKPTSIVFNTDSDAILVMAKTDEIEAQAGTAQLQTVNTWGGILVEVNDVILRFMTFNIRHALGLDHKVDMDRIKEQIVLSNADVIGLQEVDRFNLRSGFKDQIKELGNTLGMSWAFSPSINLGWAQYGNAILSKYPIENSSITKLPSRIETRSVLQVDIKVNAETVRVYNTHLGVSEKDRGIQMPLLMNLLDKAKKPSIILGDFNMETDHSLMNSLNSKWQKVEVGKSTVLSGKEIDHIYYNMPGKVHKAWTQPSPASDHHPVVTELTWRSMLQLDQPTIELRTNSFDRIAR